MTKVSVIVPTYDRAGTIEAAVDSLLAQTWRNLEVIVVDDGSHDDTRSRLARYGRAITVVPKPNGGVASARNMGLAHSSGELIAWMDSDDICESDRIAIQVEVMRRNPRVVLCASDFSAFRDGSGEFASSYAGAYYHAIAKAGGALALFDVVETMDFPGREATRVGVGFVYEQIVWGNFLHPPTVMVRRHAMLAAGGFDPAFPNNGEYDMILRIVRSGLAAYVQAPLLRYRCGPNQMSDDANLARLKLDLTQIMQKLLAEDPELARRDWNRVQARIARNFIDAARLLSADDRRHAWTLFARAYQHALLPLAMAGALPHLVLPELVKNGLRAIKRRVFGPSAVRA